MKTMSVSECSLLQDGVEGQQRTMNALTLETEVIEAE
jgi:hypothetical protein